MTSVAHICIYLAFVTGIIGGVAGLFVGLMLAERYSKIERQTSYDRGFAAGRAERDDYYGDVSGR